MSSTNGNFRLRQMQPSDSAAVTGLITEFDGDMTTRFLVDPYKAITYGTENETIGVVVEEEDRYGLVGMGTMRLFRAQLNGETLPMAFLDGLKVQPAFRGQGLGWRIAEWRVRKARERFGEQGIIATGMLHENSASRGVAKKWCREFLDQVFAVWVMPVRKKPPRAPNRLRPVFHGTDWVVHTLVSPEDENLQDGAQRSYWFVRCHGPYSCAPARLAR